MFLSQPNKYDCKYTCYYEGRCQVLNEHGQYQCLSSSKSIFMVVIALEHCNKFKPSIITMEQFYSNLYDKSDQDASTTATHL